MINLLTIDGDLNKRLELDEHFKGYRVISKTYIIADITKSLLTGMLKQFSKKDYVKDYLSTIHSIRFINEPFIKWSRHREIINKYIEHYKGIECDEADFERTIKRLSRRIKIHMEEVESCDTFALEPKYCLNAFYPVPLEFRTCQTLLEIWCDDNWGTEKDNIIIRGRVANNISLYRFACVQNLEVLAQNISRRYNFEITHYYCDGDKTIKTVFYDGKSISSTEDDDSASFKKYCKRVFPSGK